MANADARFYLVQVPMLQPQPSTRITGLPEAGRGIHSNYWATAAGGSVPDAKFN
jgi:hypothetical protein